MAVGPECRFVAVSGSHSKNTKIYIYDPKNGSNIKQKKVRQPTNKTQKKQLLKSADAALEVFDVGQLLNYEMNLSPDGKFSTDSIAWCRCIDTEDWKFAHCPNASAS